ncbi:MAG: HDOD domain-containing protein [Magnetococcales bacterium]|nr:HDOD domain-containing protein [Magnetococcales bacterium]
MDAKFITQAESILASVKFPPQPEIVLRINEEVRSPQPDFAKISTLLTKDPALSARVIKLANSSLFQLSSPVKSISHAMTILGLENFSRIVLTSALRDVLKSQHVTDNRLIAHLLSVAVVADSALTSRLQEFELGNGIAYLCGLFHDVGMVAMMQKFPSYQKEILDYSFGHFPDVVAVENQKFTTNHCAVGSLVARTWNLPRTICDAILYHHDVDFPELISDLTTIKLVAMIQLSDYFGNKYFYRSGQSSIFDMKQWSAEGFDATAPNVLFELGLSVEDIEEMDESIDQKLAGLAEEARQ